MSELCARAFWKVGVLQGGCVQQSEANVFESFSARLTRKRGMSRTVFFNMGQKFAATQETVNVLDRKTQADRGRRPKLSKLAKNFNKSSCRLFSFSGEKT